MDANVIAHAGKHSLSFQTSLILLEETILNGSSLCQPEVEIEVPKPGRRKKGNKEEVKEKIMIPNQF